MSEQTVSIIAVLKDGVSKVAEGMGRSFEMLHKGVEGLNRAIEPLTGGFAGLIAGFASFSVIEKSVEAFKQAELAAIKLKSALGDSGDQLGKVQAQADEVAEKTVLSKKDLNELQAELLNRGVSVAQLNTAVEASVQTSQALGMGLQRTGMLIAQTYTTGVVPARIACVARVEELN